MKVEKRGKSYRIRPVINGKQVSVTFDYKPTQKDIADAISKLTDDFDKKESFSYYSKLYVRNRENVLSPSSVRTYDRLIKSLSKRFRDLPLRSITQDDVQAEINDYAVDHAPKTVRSLHGFIASVLAVYRPSMILKTTLPQKECKDHYLPSQSDIKAILEASEGSEYHVGFQLGILGCRCSEIAALTLDDLKDNYITISKNVVYYKKWMLKDTPKTDASYRTICIPDSLRDEILNQGYIYRRLPTKLNEALHRYQDQLGIPRFRFHDLRHYFASYASTIMPEADVMALGGWKSSFVFEQVYRESMNESRKASAKKIADNIIP